MQRSTAGVLVMTAACWGAAASAPATTTAPASKPTDILEHAKVGPWRPIFRGVELCEASAQEPRPLQVRAIRVDLHDAAIDFLVTPSNGDEPLDTGARTTSEFLAEFGCQVALNASVFDRFAKKKGDPQDIEGLSLSRGDLYSPPNKYDAILIGRDRKAWLDRAPVDPEGAYNGVSGFYAMLVGGENHGTMKDLHPRSALGISRDGRYLILLAIDGRQPGYSTGTTTAETAEWMRRFGAYDALSVCNEIK